MKSTWISYELHVNSMNTFDLILYEIHGKFIGTPYEVHMNFLWISYE